MDEALLSTLGACLGQSWSIQTPYPFLLWNKSSGDATSSVVSSALAAPLYQEQRAAFAQLPWCQLRIRGDAQSDVRPPPLLSFSQRSPMQGLGLSQGESRGMAGLLVPSGAQAAHTAGYPCSFPSVDVGRVVPHPWDLPHQLVQFIMMGLVPAGAGRASSGAEQSSPGWQWLCHFMDLQNGLK